MKIFTEQELKEILENHAKWLAGEDDGAQANLRGADLRNADLRGANLRGADLCGADLCGADLYGADLRDTDLRGANLSGADLRGADLYCANLYGANLRCTKLCGADLCDTDLRDTDLCGADLYGANLRCTNLCGAKNIPFIPYCCPDSGSFVGYKKVGNYIVELEILADAKRCSATTRKCRCNKAKVLSIQNIDGTIADITVVASNYDKDFKYKVGAIVEVKNFDDNRWNECSTGIHFFINRQEAVEHNI